MTNGYHGRPEKTAEAYGENPFPHPAGYERVYRTGDLVRFLPDGNLQFIGRRDGQVKIRGFRVELTEVEEVLRRFPGVKDAAAAAFDDAAGGKYLAGYVVSDAPVDTNALGAFIRAEKPPYMVPAVILQIDSIPVNRNQKIDRRALPKPERKAEKLRLPENELQRKLTDVIAEILGHSGFGTDTDLFLAGLTSIGTLRLNVALSEAFGKTLKLSDLKENSTVLALEKLLSAQEDVDEEPYGRLPDYPLTQTQMGIFVECSASPDSINYNMPMLMKLGTGLDARRLAAAVKAALSAHPYVRTTLFADAEGNIRARRNDAAAPEVSLLTCEKLPAADQLVRSFPLLGAPLYRIAVYETGEGVYLFMDIHHIISDGTSQAILLKDIEKAYFGGAPEPEKYTGFEAALEEEKTRASERFAAAKRYYDSIFTGCETECLPPGAPESDQPLAGSITRVCAVRPEAVRSFCESGSFTPNAFFNAAFGFALSRFTGPDEVVFTTVYNGRSDPRLASSVTMLVKTLPVLVRTEADRPVRGLIRETGEQLMNSMANDIFSFAEVSSAYGIRSDMIVVYQGDEFAFDSLCGEKAELIDLMPGMIKAPLTVNIFLKDCCFELRADYRKDMFCAELVGQLLAAMDAAAQEFLVREKLSDVSLLTEADEKKLAAMNDTARSFENIPAHRFFERQAASCPDRTAVICGGKQLSYAELNRRANVLAWALIARGVGRDSVIGLMLDRSAEVLVTELGILKAGGAFLGLLPSYPDERAAFCLTDSDCRIVITTQQLKEERTDLFSADRPYLVLTLEEIFSQAGTDADRDPDPDISPDSLAYCIYTSGSTGKPKGVMIEHHSLVNCAQPADFPYAAYCGEKRGRAALAMSSLAFDMSVFDSLLPLMNGMTVVYATEKEIHDPAAMAKLIRETHVDTMSATPSYLTNLLGCEEFREAAKGLRTVVAGAEAFPPVLYTELKKIAPELTVLNGYGPTECTMTCCAKELRSEKSITIGGPAANVAFYTVDRFGNVLPPYACGELIICGECVGRGYIRLPEKSAAAFFTLRGLPAYRSGDIVRLNRDGEAEFFGRHDSQVKLRGFRVELDEVERCICSFEGVTQSKVIVRSNGTEDYLAAFFTAALPVDTAKLTEYLRSKLSYYMVPSAILQLDAMPLTASGKIDKKALPEIRPEKKKAGRRAAKKSLEQELCELFGTVLSLDEYYADDDFFEMGGTSLSASKVVMQLMAKGIRVEYQDIFDNPTPEKLAGLIGGRTSEKKEESAAAEEDSASGYREELRYNTLEYAAEVKREPLGSVLLTGATGFLGIHILRELLEREEGSILCLVRKGRHESPEERLKSMLVYYFGESFDEAFAGRITALDADITDERLEELLAPYPVDTVINCAANVKHYAADDSIERINVYGARNLIRTALSHSARMIQISTVSVPGVHTEESWKKRAVMHENELFVIDDMNNQYGISKYRAELELLEAIRRDGLRGKIIRIGNLMGRHSDGEFQINFNTNAFMNSLRGFATIGKCPVSHATDPMRFSPVDMTARAVVLLTGTNDRFTAFHADNRFGFDEWQLVEAANRSGVAIRPVPDEEYYADYYRLLSDKSVNARLQGLMTNDRPDLHAVETDNTFTANVLYRLGFSWPMTDIDYLEKTIVSLKTLGFFD